MSVLMRVARAPSSEIATSRPWVAVAAGVWLLATGGLLVWGGGVLPLGSSHHDPWTAAERLGSAHIILVEVTALALIVARLTRSRQDHVTSLLAAGPDRPAARRELVGLTVYLAAAQGVGVLIGLLSGWGPISFHLAGSIHGTDEVVAPTQAIAWAGYNAVAYALVPLWWFRRKYRPAQLWLRSGDRRGDARVISLVLIVESVFQLLVIGPALLALSTTQLSIGAALTVLISFLGTVLPTLVVVAALVVPRVLALTGSRVAAVIAGGGVYVALHMFEGWTDFSSPRLAVLSLSLLVLQYLVPGMFKAYLTVRTGNAWAHAWAYHSVAPHVWADTPLMVRIFGLR